LHRPAEPTGTKTDEDGVPADTLSAGAELAGRYRINDLVGETARSQLWRAADRVLNRSVSVQVVRSDDLSAEAFLTAARRATAVEDPRFLRVLDAAHENGYAYVVREWAAGVSLDSVLRQGPLSGLRAAEVMREIAEAVAAAHRAGVQHRRLDPARVIVKRGGAVRMLGLATDQSLHAPNEDVESSARAGEAADVDALGRLLYACLVARWPGSRDLGLPAAPTEHGRLLRPRQVRAGVDPAVELVCTRILGSGPRQHGDRLRTAQQVARELAALAGDGEALTSFAPADDDDQTIQRGQIPVGPDPAGPPPAVHVIAPPRATRQAQLPGPRTDRATRRRGGGRGAVLLALVLLLGLVGTLVVLALRSGDGDDPGGETSANGTGPTDDPAELLRIQELSDFDPQGTDGEENPETAAFAGDGDVSTAWTTESYFNSPELGLLKDGAGLLVDLGRTQPVQSVSVRLVGAPTSIEVHAAPEQTTSEPTVLSQLRIVGGKAEADTDVTVRPESPLTTRYLVVWLTSLPPVEADTYMGSVAEVSVRG